MFGPVKYGILPDLLAKEELLAGNALVEAATFIAIFLGLIAGGLSVMGRTLEGTILQLLAIAIACFAASCALAPLPNAQHAAATIKKFRIVFMDSSYR